MTEPLIKKPLIKPPIIKPVVPCPGGDDDSDDSSCTPGSKLRKAIPPAVKPRVIKPVVDEPTVVRRVQRPFIRKELQPHVPRDVLPITRKDPRPIAREEVRPIARKDVRPIARNDVRHIVRRRRAPFVYRRRGPLRGAGPFRKRGIGGKGAPLARGGRVFQSDPPLAFRDPLAFTPKLAPKKPPRVVSVEKPVILPKPPLVVSSSPPCSDDDDDDRSCTPGSKLRAKVDGKAGRPALGKAGALAGPKIATVEPSAEELPPAEVDPAAPIVQASPEASAPLPEAALTMASPKPSPPPDTTAANLPGV